MRFGASLFLARPKKIPPRRIGLRRNRLWQPRGAWTRRSFRRFTLGRRRVCAVIIRRTCGEDALADDILQEAFLRFLRADLSAGGSAFEGRQLKAYLYKIAASLVCDHWRRVRRESRWSRWISGRRAGQIAKTMKESACSYSAR